MPEPLVLATTRNFWSYAEVAQPGEPIVPLPEHWTRRRLGTTIEVAGLWGRVGRVTAAVYAREDELLVQLGMQVIRLEPAVSVQHAQGRLRRRLVIISDGTQLFAASYLRPLRSFVHLYDNWATEGDYDFGAFIAEIAERAFRPGDPLLAVWPFTRHLDRENGEKVLAGWC